MMHPELWLVFVQQRQRELWAEAEHTALVQRLKPSLFKRLLMRLTDNLTTITAHGDDEQTFAKPEFPNNRSIRGTLLKDELNPWCIACR